jgi:uncharacterized protein
VQPGWYSEQVLDYMERNVYAPSTTADRNAFRTFVTLCAKWIGQQLNLSALAFEAGISYKTAQAWISFLEASYILFRMYPYYKNLGTRFARIPKLYFYDTGLACNLLRIESVTQLTSHYLRGGLFESYIMADLYKQHYNAGIRPALYFWMDKKHEVDCIIEQATSVVPIEMKAGKTLNTDLFDSLTHFREVSKEEAKPGILIYGGNNAMPFKGNTGIPWNQAGKLIETLHASKP